MSRKRRVSRATIVKQVIYFVGIAGDRWTFEHDVVKYIAERYKNKISKATAKNYVDEVVLMDGLPLRRGKKEDERGQIFRALRPA